MRLDPHPLVVFDGEPSADRDDDGERRERRRRQRRPQTRRRLLAAFVQRRRASARAPHDARADPRGVLLVPRRGAGVAVAVSAPANEHRFAFAARFPALLYAAAPVALFAPTAGMYPRARRKPRDLWRGSSPRGAAAPLRRFFAADVACSLAKSLSDVERAVCTMAAGAERVSRAAAFDEDGPCGSHSWRVPFALALPSLIRLAQCLRAFADTRRKAHLWNALKYASGFPVVFLSYAKYGVAHEAWIGTYRPAWIACAVINAAYSYYWDVTKDWGLTLFSSSRPGAATSSRVRRRRRRREERGGRRRDGTLGTRAVGASRAASAAVRLARVVLPRAGLQPPPPRVVGV